MFTAVQRAEKVIVTDPECVHRNPALTRGTSDESRKLEAIRNHSQNPQHSRKLRSPIAHLSVPAMIHCPKKDCEKAFACPCSFLIDPEGGSQEKLSY